MEQLKKCRISILISLVVMLVNTLLDIWEFQCTIDSSSILIGEKWKNALRKKLSSWKAKYLSYGGRLVLLNSVLNSLPMFMMSFLRSKKGYLKILIISDRDSFGKDLLISISIDLPNGTYFVVLRIKGDLVS